MQEEESSKALNDLLDHLRTLLGQWEEKEYPSDEERYKSYYEDVEKAVEKYDPCAHPGQSCEEAHLGLPHHEC
tara:strand:- start:524 stop:742 length:219 start_codon:yes stop_codon:yes gene_type:complete